MEPVEEIKKDLNDGLANIKKQIDEKGEAQKKDLEVLQSKFQISEEEIKKGLEALGLQVKEMKDGKTITEKTLRDQVEEQKEAITKAVANKSCHTFQVNKTLVQGSSVTNNTMGYRLQDIGRTATRLAVIEPSLMSMPLPNGFNGQVRYYEDETLTRGAATRAEGDARGESAITWVERFASLKNIGDWIPVTEEALMDVDFIQAEINNLLDVNMKLIVDSQLWNGNGLTTNLKGIYTYANAFDAAAYVANGGLKFKFASLLELIDVLKKQISVGYESKFMPQTIYMNPMDLQALRFAKDNDGAYLNPAWAYGGMSLPGLVESSIVTQNTMLVGDMNYTRVYNALGYTAEVGRINDDFIKGKVAIRTSRRMLNLVRNIDIPSMLKVTDISATIAAITETGQ